MSIEAAVTAWLSAFPAAQKAVGSRIYPQSLPQGASFPALTYYRTSHQSLKSLAGLSGLSQARVSVDCWALNYTDAHALADAIRGNKTNPGLDGYRGTVGGVRIQSCFCTNQMDQIERPVHGDEKGVPHCTLDFELWYEDV